jgi:hypothetical protein
MVYLSKAVWKNVGGKGHLLALANGYPILWHYPLSWHMTHDKVWVWVPLHPIFVSMTNTWANLLAVWQVL